MIGAGLFKVNFEQYAVPEQGPANVLDADGRVRPVNTIYALMWIGLEDEEQIPYAIGVAVRIA